MNKELVRKPWMIALIILAAVGLIGLGYLGSRMILGRQFGGDAFPQARFGGGQFADGERLGGEIVALNQGQLSIESPDGELFEFNITAATEFGDNGGLAALEVGTFAIVSYESADDGSLTAIFVGAAPGDGAGLFGRGTGGRGQQ